MWLGNDRSSYLSLGLHVVVYAFPHFVLSCSSIQVTFRHVRCRSEAQRRWWPPWATVSQWPSAVRTGCPAPQPTLVPACVRLTPGCCATASQVRHGLRLHGPMLCTLAQALWIPQLVQTV